MQGRLLGFQEHPFECQSNYGGVGALRCNLDVQDLRRVLLNYNWMDENEEKLPHIGDQPEWGYMNKLMWTGEKYEDLWDLEGVDPQAWDDELQPADWRDILLELYNKPTTYDGSDDDTLPDYIREEYEAQTREADDSMKEAIAAFSDGINTGFYINSYTTKHCPTMDGVLEELRKGIARKEAQRESEALRLKEAEEEKSKVLNHGPEIPKKKSDFAEALSTLSRLSSSYRRCYWKSGSEMIFPILYGHLTFASHRCWTIYIKKAIFLATQAWRNEYGDSVLHARKQKTLEEPILFQRPGHDDYPLVGWSKEKIGTEWVYDGPQGQRCTSIAEAFDEHMSSKVFSAKNKDTKSALSILEKFLSEDFGTAETATEKHIQEEKERQVVVTTSTLEDYLWRGDDASVLYRFLQN